MKIFSNFDTNRKEEAYQEAIDKFWEDRVLVLRKSWLFFIEKVFLPIFSWTIILALLLYGFYFVGHSRGSIWYFIFIIWVIAYLILISPNIKYYLDYKMGFSLVTPMFLTRYNQSGFFKRDIKSSSVKNIKTISIQKDSFWYNLFDNWDLIFLSEWDRADQGEITLHYIHDPEDKRKLITHIMRPSIW